MDIAKEKGRDEMVKLLEGWSSKVGMESGHRSLIRRQHC